MILVKYEAAEFDALPWERVGWILVNQSWKSRFSA
jgi:hypothetical protein